jgi:hypothetical protein
MTITIKSILVQSRPVASDDSEVRLTDHSSRHLCQYRFLGPYGYSSRLEWGWEGLVPPTFDVVSAKILSCCLKPVCQIFSPTLF